MSLTSLQSMLKIKLRVMKRGELVKQKFNLHTHTTRCGHAEGLDIQYVESAIDAGFKMLGFSDHIPFAGVKMPGDRMSYEQKKEYVLSLKELQKKYHEQIDIKIGYEIEYFEEYDEYYLELRKECDYFILGQHLNIWVMNMIVIVLMMMFYPMFNKLKMQSKKDLSHILLIQIILC
jgi:histidinol phosphatase-like PHP family hydrolase